MKQIANQEPLNSCGQKSCMSCTKRPLSLLDDLSMEELMLIEKDRTSRTYRAGEIIFQEGGIPAGLLSLYTGKVKITRSGLFETPVVVALKRPVDFLGLNALILEKKYEFTATALEDSTICTLDKTSFLEVLKANANLSLKVMRLLALELNMANKRMLSLTQKHMRGRLADALLLLLNEYGTLVDQKTLNVELKRADLAAMANMTPANAIRILSVFSKEHLIETDKRQIIIKNLEALREVSQLG